jgi:hypothetical protein
MAFPTSPTSGSDFSMPRKRSECAEAARAKRKCSDQGWLGALRYEYS